MTVTQNLPVNTIGNVRRAVKRRFTFMLGCKELTEACKNASSNAIQKKQINTIQIIFPQQKKLNLTSGLLVEYKKPVGKKAHLHVPSN